MTGTLERPSQGAPENRKAADHRRQDTDLKKGARRALAALADADMQLLVAGQQQVRRQALSSIDAALGASHASQRAAVVARYGNRRSALGSIADAGTRNAALLQLIAEEAAELARLALALADDKQRLKRETVANHGHRPTRGAASRAAKKSAMGVWRWPYPCSHCGARSWQRL